MAEPGEFERIKEDDDPNRCQGNDSRGQCRLLSMKDSDYCKLHGGSAAANKANKEGLRNLQLTKWHIRLSQLGNSPDIMSLRDEIGVTRMLLESILNQCEGIADLIISAPQISHLTSTISKLVKDCHNIEEKTGHLLDKSTLMKFGGAVITIINEHIDDEDMKRVIAGEILIAASNLNKDDDEG